MEPLLLFVLLMLSAPPSTPTRVYMTCFMFPKKLGIRPAQLWLCLNKLNWIFSFPPPLIFMSSKHFTGSILGEHLWRHLPLLWRMANLVKTSMSFVNFSFCYSKHELSLLILKQIVLMWSFCGSCWCVSKLRWSSEKERCVCSVRVI